MSADNGIYILQTEGPEFRVAYQQNIDDIYGNFSDESFRWQGDPETMFSYFGDAPVFPNLEEALDKAEELKDWDFNKLKENYGTEAKSGSR